ncbi:hypothetical protein Z517_10874 [Fonsecaea pedrosoi CBS 271.37]|uniref:Uncharacterized protein n=1 Tax=Fonsecaea pedrosoi CBS 271.37 TaxID=1442368 RepID=A0A0D2GUS3_9EURO|nr:uncharacterized protein Z517_10874 [Fonsecaea pedrosoi CBS 271.37]KIW76129.1 hypothetical protein Z517_10874 [Fonsecaea pedrosoi CBS 271.37]
MVALALALGAAIYFTAEKVRDHKKKKAALKDKDQQAPPYDSIPPSASALENRAARRSVDQLPQYVYSEPPPYHIKDPSRGQKVPK